MAERPPSRPREAWQDGPPSRPRVAWQEVGTLQEVSPPPQPNQADVVQPREIDASWLPVYELEQQHVDFIVAFVSSPEKEESQKMQFLRSICKVCNTSRAPGMSKGLDLFCQRYELAENIKMLLEEERSGQMWMAVQQHAMLAIAKLSTVEGVLEGKEKSLLQVCFCSIFLAPPKEEMQGLSHDLYPVTMQTMDIMLKKLMLGCRVSRVSEMLQDIFQMLLTFTKSRKASVRERAIGRMTMLSHLLANLLKADPNGDRQASYAEIQLPILGQLLGHLILLLSFKEEETSRLALDILCSLFQFKHQQRCKRNCGGMQPSAHQHHPIPLLVFLGVAMDLSPAC